jgi:hypothetical protein
LAEVQEAEPPGQGPGPKPRHFVGIADWQHLCTIRSQLQSAPGSAIRPRKDIEALRSQIDHQLQILGEQVALLNEV